LAQRAPDLSLQDQQPRIASSVTRTRRGELIDHVFASHWLVNPDDIPAVEIVHRGGSLPSMTDDLTPKTSAPSDHAAIVATFSL
jgi:hypothetical protein